MIRKNFFILLVQTLIFFACENQNDREERLAQTYCGSCHLFPEPSLLDKNRWKSDVLPEMAFRMGLETGPLFNMSQADRNIVLSTLPARPMVSQEEWAAIVNYFSRTAPDSLVLTEKTTAENLSQFEPELISLEQNRIPRITMLKADTTTKTIWTSNRNSWIHQYDFSFSLLDSIQVPSSASFVDFQSKDNVYMTVMGIMDPNDQYKGSLIQVFNKQKEIKNVIDSLQRPVHFEKVDFNKDGLPDFVICSFGNYTGELLVYQNLGNDRFKKHVLSYLPGSRKIEVKDFNGDGLLDVIALITQGDEKISLFLNKGNFKFEEKILLRFPPIYGSSYFEVIDFNKDGFFDLLYTNGDNADYSITLKPYHEVRIYLNDGTNQFTETWFYSMYGCSWAVARDFDLDGDLDVAAISFFPAYSINPEKGFIYFENKGDKMEAYTTDYAMSGRWLLMETVDIDGDMDEDIVLGALNFTGGLPTSVTNGWKEKPTTLLLLRNRQMD